MSLVIRLSPTGRKGLRTFRLVVSEKRSKRDGKPLETLGWYTKREKAAQKELKIERIKYWIEKGASVSTAVKTLMES